MPLIQKISALKLSASFAVLMAAATPDAMASLEVFSIEDTTPSSSVSSDLELTFPRHFRGLNGIDRPDVLRNRDINDLKSLMGYDPAIPEKLVELTEVLTQTSNPVFEKLITDIKKATKDKEQQTVLHCILFLGRAALAASTKTEEERHFFKFAGFSNPYKLIDLIDPTTSFWSALQHLGDEGTRGDFEHITGKNFSDPTDAMDKLLEKSPFYSRPFLMLMTQPKEDIFGFFTLALTYYKGKHPVPVTLSTDGSKLHGIAMSPWGKFCHDLAHSEVDPANHSVEQFANHILNLYTRKLRETFKDLTTEERAQFSVKAMIPPVTQFALDVHSAYRQSLVDILESSLLYFNVRSDLKKLPPEFEAFSVAAFLDAHEEASDMSMRYATADLVELLKSSRSKTALEIIPQKNEGAPSSSSGGSEERITVEKNQDLFTTSFTTGETLLSDEEIFEIAKKLPLSAYLLHYYHIGGDQPINTDEIAGYSVTRNKFYIEISIDMLDGENYLLRQATNYSRTLNLSHDRQILRPAAAVLAEKYGYKIPVVPNPLNEDYEEKVAACDKALREGMKYLHDIFAFTATKVSLQDTGSDMTIADQFAVRYTKALRKLAKSMPGFVTDAEGGLQGFLTKATSKEAISNLYNS